MRVPVRIVDHCVGELWISQSRRNWQKGRPFSLPVIGGQDFVFGNIEREVIEGLHWHRWSGNKGQRGLARGNSEAVMPVFEQTQTELPMIEVAHGWQRCRCLQLELQNPAVVHGSTVVLCW